MNEDGPGSPLPTARMTIVMGVAGSGKTTLAAALATATHGHLLDADDFHSAANKQKMASGTPLTDQDRGPWLDTLNHQLKQEAAHGSSVFLACSALRQSYRARLTAGLCPVVWVYLRIDPELARQRIQARAASGHFMPSTLIASQFAALEEPPSSEALILDAATPIALLVTQYLQRAPPNDRSGGEKLRRTD